MQSPLRTLDIRYRTRFAVCQRLVFGGCALATIAASVALPGSASAQRSGGEIGVSLTILPTSTVQSVALAGAAMDRNGGASIPTAPRTTARGVVTTSLSRNRRGSGSASQEPAPPCAASRADCAAQGIGHHRVDFGTCSADDAAREVRVRHEYVVVPGT